LNSAEQIRVVLLDEHALVRTGLRLMLEPADEINIVGDASVADEAIALVRQTQAQVLIMDRPSGGEDAGQVIERLAQAGVRTNLLVLTVLGAQAGLDALLAGGARGYLTRSASGRDLLDAVRAVSAGVTYRCPLVVAARGTDAATGSAAEVELRRFERLTDREREVLVCTAHGFSAPEIGARLHISAKTVDTYKQRIHEKLGLHHRTDYVRMALRLRLMDVG
jgi:DNA-binding NarL/FixJ family response regulator